MHTREDYCLIIFIHSFTLAKVALKMAVLYASREEEITLDAYLSPFNLSWLSFLRKREKKTNIKMSGAIQPHPFICLPTILEFEFDF